MVSAVGKAARAASSCERTAAGTAPASLARLQFMAGDLLAAVPAAASAKDAYLLSAVLHGMDLPLAEGIALESRLGAVVKGRNAGR